MLKHPDIISLIDSMAQALRKRDGIEESLIIGIHSGGAWIAQHLHQTLGNTQQIGMLDISFYRDDFTQIGLNPQVKSSDLPDSIEGRDIILVDDVLHSGRTIRAAMNELFDYGRPKSISLAVLLDREGRQLPIQADVCGMNIHLAPHQQVKLSYVDNEFALKTLSTNTTDL
ncbi:MAG: bifunctional pyr operon transcriptional regulator/uracil phosphoribosyltransferase PyrR [Hyphomicrobiales bacterium]|nr:bifunctional pyr operon transcriptional regulator/uracil phosphoribosyltransferase PyrR [Hyphomicrobiales bacterium]